MNKIYKVIWSKTRNCYVAVSELAKSHTKGCSLKRMGRVLAAGAVAAGIMLPMEEAEAFSSSYVSYYSGNSSPDYQTDGGHVDGIQIGGYDPNWGYHYYVFANEDGTIDFYKNDNYQKMDISSMIGNVAIGNFAEAGSAADAKQVNFYQYYSYQVAYEVKPETATGTWNSMSYNGKTYYYPSNSSYRTYAYTPTNSYGGTVIEKDGKYYHRISDFEPELDGEGNWQFDTNGNPIGKTVIKFAEIGSTIWKKDPNNPNGNLIVDYKKTETDEYGNVRPVFDLTAEDVGISDDNYYAYSGGTNNVAVGNKSKTVSHSSVAVGDSSTARGWRSIAIGAQSEAGADPETTYVGSWNDGTSAVAVGNSAKAYGSTSVAVGNGSQTYSFSGVAVGNGANASTEYAIAIGDNARVAYVNGAGDIEQQRTAAQSIAIGRDALAQAKDVTAVGRNAQGMMRNATAYGNNSHANGWNSIAIGNKATAGLQAEILNDDGTAKDGAIANSAIAIGNRARATAEYTTAIGAGTNAEGWHAVAVGDSNQATGKFSTAIGAGWSINHTEGEPDSDDATDGSDAINTEGKRTYESIGANQAGGDYSTAAGYGNKTVGTQSNAFGKENEVSGLSSLGVGAGNKVGAVAVGDDGILAVAADQENTVSGYAVGSYNTITGSEGSNAGAFGANNTVAGDNSYATGNSNTIGENSANSFVFGNNVSATEAGTVVVGHHDPEEKDNTTAGDGTTPTFTFGENSVSLGTNAAAQTADSVALGSYSISNRAAGSAGPGYDVTTGRSYDGRDNDNPAWTSTLGAVSVGVDKTDGSVGSVAKQTRQITGVAAGTADTDAVNVAQLKLIRSHYYSVNVDTDDSPDGEDSNYDNLGATGAGSLAAGFYTIASGDQSVSTGYKAMAASDDSTAYGVDSTSVGKGSIALGHKTTSGALVSIDSSDDGSTAATYKSNVILVNKQNDDGQTESYVFRNLKKDAEGNTEVVAYNTVTGEYYTANPDENDKYTADSIGEKRNDITEGDAVEGKKQVNMGGIAMGSYAHAEGDRSVALGRASGAYGEASTALGIYANAVGDGSLAIGHGSSTDVKAEVIPSGDEGTAEWANGFWTTEIAEKDGNNNPKSNGAIGGIAIGSYAHTEGTRALAVGRVAGAYGTNSTAVGLRSNAYGEGSIAFGHGVKAGSDTVVVDKDGNLIDNKYATQVPELHNNPQLENDQGLPYDLDGKDNIKVDPTNVVGAVAIGSYAEATGRGTLSVGRYSKAESAYSTALGIRADAGVNSENAIAIGRETKVTAFETDENGNVKLDENGKPITKAYGGANSIAMGTMTSVNGQNSIAIGTADMIKDGEVVAPEDRKATSVVGDSSIAIGQNDTIVGDNSIAIGTGHVIKGSNSGAFGDPSYINDDNAYAIGNNNSIEEGSANSFVVGNNVTTTAANTIVVGNHTKDNTHTFGKNSASLGFDAVAQVDDSVALGSYSVASTGLSTGGYNVLTGARDYVDTAITSAWKSTHGAVSVGTADGTVTRQITGVAAGTRDTDAVNVAQLRLAGTRVEQGNNITVTSETSETGGTAYTVNGLKTEVTSNDGTVKITGGEANDKGVITYDLSVEVGDVDTNTTYKFDTTKTEDTSTTNVVSTTKVKSSTDGKTYTETGETFNDTDTKYTGTQSVTGGGKGEGSTTFNFTNNYDDTSSSMTIKAGDNVTITEQTDDNGKVIGAVINAAGDTTYTYNDTTQKAQEENPAIVQQTTIIQNNPDGSTSTVATISDTDTNTITKVTSDDGSVTVTGGKEVDGVITYDLSVNAKNTVTNIEAGNNVHVKSVTKGDNITYTVSADKSVIVGGDNVTVTSETDEETNTTTYKVNAQDTTYSYTDTTEEAKKDNKSVVQQITVKENKPDGTTEVAKFTDTDTTYEIKTEAGEKGSGIVNTYTMIGTNGKEYTFQDTDTDTDTTYKMSTNRVKKGTTAATMTITDSNGKEVGKFEDTHNGLKEGPNGAYEVTYDDKGVGTVTIEDQDGNTATITNIRSLGGEGIADSINHLGDRINHLDNKINKVGAGAAALAGLHPLDFDPDEKWDFSAAAGSYKGEHAVAIGAFYRPNEDTMFSIGGTIGNGNNMVNVGVSWKFGQKNRISANRISSAKEIIELRKNQEDVHSFLADAVAGNQLDLSKIQLFPDVEENHWAYDYVATMAGNGVLEGYPDGYFKGNRNMTRYEMAAVLYRLMQNGARLSDKALTEFAPELDRIRVDTITKHKDGTPHIQRVRTIKERVDEKADPSSEKTAKKKTKVKVAEKPVE